MNPKPARHSKNALATAEPDLDIPKLILSAETPLQHGLLS